MFIPMRRIENPNTDVREARREGWKRLEGGGAQGVERIGKEKGCLVRVTNVNIPAIDSDNHALPKAVRGFLR